MSARDALRNRLMCPDAMRRIDWPWRYSGGGVIEDANGVPVCFMSNYHEAQIPLIVNAPKLLAAANEALRFVTGKEADALRAAIDAAEEPAP